MGWSNWVHNTVDLSEYSNHKRFKATLFCPTLQINANGRDEWNLPNIHTA